MPDGERIISDMSLTLNLIDRFYNIGMIFLGKNLYPPQGTAKQVGNALEIDYGGQLAAKIPATQLNFNEWSEIRYWSLYRRVKTNFELFYEYYSEEPGHSPDERARIRVRMGRIKAELCEDFKEMVGMFNRTLGYALPDHYELRELCEINA